MPGTYTPTTVRRPAGNDPFSYVPEAQDYLREGVQGYGQMLQPQVLKDVGSALGSLNDIGALRSGGTKVALEDISSKYGAMVGAYAKQATEAGVGYGLEARKERFAEDEAKRRRKAGLLKAIGAVLGAGIGFIASGGNPAGLVAGGKIGGAIGGGGQEASDAGGVPGDFV